MGQLARACVSKETKANPGCYRRGVVQGDRPVDVKGQEVKGPGVILGLIITHHVQLLFSRVSLEISLETRFKKEL